MTAQDASKWVAEHNGSWFYGTRAVVAWVVHDTRIELVERGTLVEAVEDLILKLVSRRLA